MSEKDKHGYPTQGFFVAHKRYFGPGFDAQGEWGDILDGPVTEDDRVIDEIMRSWDDDIFPPDFDDLRVWFVGPDGVREYTRWAVETVAQELMDQEP